jgi:hypothetical protein
MEQLVAFPTFLDSGRMVGNSDLCHPFRQSLPTLRLKDGGILD